MKVLVVGDIVGKSGMDKLKDRLPNIKKENNIDFCIVNGENSAAGKGIRVKEYNEILAYGADCITMGNHLYYRKEMASEYKNLPLLVIPANVTNLEGNHYVIIEKNNCKIAVINLIGRAEMGELFQKNTTNPFKQVDEELKKILEIGVDYIFVDFHAEATAEKIAMSYHLDGRVTAVYGTHTHVQTADEIILKKGTAYITDVGMTGPKGSVIGLKREVALKRFIDETFEKYECSANDAILNAIILHIDDTTKKVIKIERIFER